MLSRLGKEKKGDMREERRRKRKNVVGREKEGLSVEREIKLEKHADRKV